MTAQPGALLYVENADSPSEDVTLTLGEDVAELVVGLWGGVRIVSRNMIPVIRAGEVHLEAPWAMPGNLHQMREDGSVREYNLGDMCLDAARTQGITIRVQETGA